MSPILLMHTGGIVKSYMKGEIHEDDGYYARQNEFLPFVFVAWIAVIGVFRRKKLTPFMLNGMNIALSVMWAFRYVTTDPWLYDYTASWMSVCPGLCMRLQPRAKLKYSSKGHRG